jgi:RNA polymerase sigma-70 factor (ECF subfamily)
MLLATVRPFLLPDNASARRAAPVRFRVMSAAVAAADDGAQGREQAALLAAMARGDKAALARLYDTLAKPLYSLAFRVTSDATESQDIIQEVFLQLWHKAAAYDTGRGSVFSWAATLTRNRAIDRVRMRTRRAELLAASAADLLPAAPAGAADSAGSLWLQEKAGAVRAALGQLAPDQRKAIELAYFSGLTQEEIAARLNEPLGTIKARVRRGLLKLREILPSRL